MIWSGEQAPQVCHVKRFATCGMCVTSEESSFRPRGVRPSTLRKVCQRARSPTGRLADSATETGTVQGARWDDKDGRKRS